MTAILLKTTLPSFIDDILGCMKLMFVKSTALEKNKQDGYGWNYFGIRTDLQLDSNNCIEMIRFSYIETRLEF